MICTSIFILLFYLSSTYPKNANHTSCGCGPFKFLCISEKTFIGCGDSDNDDGECPEGTRCDPLNAFHCTPSDSLSSQKRKTFSLPPCFKKGIFSDPNDSSGYFKCNKGAAEPLEWVPCPKNTIFSCNDKASCEALDNKKNKYFLKMLQNIKHYDPWDLKSRFFKQNKTKTPIIQNITNEMDDLETDENPVNYQLTENYNFTCSGIGNFSNGKSERSYIECIQDENKNFKSSCYSCPCDQYFSKEKRKCVRPPCLQREPFDCHAAGKFKTSGLAPAKYYECFENTNKTFSWIIKSCDFGEKFDCLTECCEPDEFAYCNKGHRITRSMRTNLNINDVRNYWPILNDNDYLTQTIPFPKRKKGNHKHHGHGRTMTNFDKDWSQAKEDFDLRSKYVWDTKKNYNAKGHHKTYLKPKFNFNSKMKQTQENDDYNFINKAEKEIQPEDFFNSKSSNILKDKENVEDLDFNILDDTNVDEENKEMTGNDDYQFENIFKNQKVNTHNNKNLNEYNNVGEEEEEQMDDNNDNKYKFIYKNKNFKKHNNHILNKDKNDEYDYDENNNENQEINLVENLNQNKHFRKIKCSNKFGLDNDEFFNNNKFQNRDEKNSDLNLELYPIEKHDWKDSFKSPSTNTKEDVNSGYINNQNIFHLNADELEPLFNGYKQFFALTNPLFFADEKRVDDDKKLSNNNEISFLKVNQETPEISDPWISSDELTNRADIFELKNDDNEFSSSDYVAVVDARACRGPRCNKEAKNETVFQCNEAGNFSDCSCEQAFYVCKPSQDGHSRFNAFHTYCSDDQFFCERKHKCVRPPCNINGNFKCHAVGKFKNNEDVHKYYNCFKDKDNKLVMSQSECSSGGIFDCKTRECSSNTADKGANNSIAKSANNTEAKSANNTEVKISNNSEAKTINDNLSKKDNKNETIIETSKHKVLDNSTSINDKCENSTKINSTKINSTKINSTKINSTKINSTKINSTSSGNKEKINIKDKHKTHNETIQQKLDKEADKCIESEHDNCDEKPNNQTTVSSKNQTATLNKNNISTLNKNNIANNCICPPTNSNETKVNGNHTNHEVNKGINKKASKKEKNNKSKANDSCAESDLDFDLMEDQCHNDTFTTNTSFTATMPNNTTSKNFNNHTKTTAQTSSSSNSTSKISGKNKYHRKAKLKHFFKGKKMKYRDRNKRDESKTNKTENYTTQQTTKPVANLTVTNNTNKVGTNESEEVQPNECMSENCELSELFDQMQAEPIDFKCEEKGIYPDPFSHRGFIQCCPSDDEDDDIVAFRFRCPHDKFFNNRIKKCSIPPCVLPQKGICLAEGNFKDCKDNSKYFRCQLEQEDDESFVIINESCPSGKQFDCSTRNCSSKSNNESHPIKENYDIKSNSAFFDREEDNSESEVLEEKNKPLPLKRVMKERRETNNPLNSISKEYILSKLLEKKNQDSFKDSDKEDVNSQLTNSVLDLFVSTPSPLISGSTMSHSDDRWQRPAGLWDRIKRGCKEDSSGRFPDSGNCTVYYVCHGKRDVMGGKFQVQLSCPPGTQFDSIFRMCIDARVARCATVVDAFDVGEMTRDIETRLVEDAEQKENFHLNAIKSLDRRIRHLQKLISKENKIKHKEKDLVVK